MPRYLMKNKDIIEAKDFTDLRKIIISKIKDDSYMRSFIKGVGA